MIFPFKMSLSYFCIFCSVVILSCSQAPEIKQDKIVSPPSAQQRPKTMIEHNDVRRDPYYWMNDSRSKEVLDLIYAENQYADYVLNKFKPLQETIEQEIKSRIVEQDSSVPYKKGNYYYYEKYEAGQQYPIYCRKKYDLSHPEEVYLDVNKMAQGKKFFSLVHLGVSRNENTVAFAVDENGSRQFSIYFKDLTTNTILDHKIQQAADEWVWANDDQTGFYIQQNQTTLRSEKVFRYSLKNKKSSEVYFEKDETFDLSLEKSLNDKTIFIESRSYDQTEIRWVSADRPTLPAQIFLTREPSVEYEVSDGGDAFYILTNWKAKNFRVLKTKNKNDKKMWKEVIPHRDDVFIQDVWALKDFLVLAIRTKAHLTFEIFDKKTAKTFLYDHKLSGPHTVSIDPFVDFSSSKLRFTIQSLISPVQVKELNMLDTTAQVLKKVSLQNYDSELYATERLWARGHDGVQIPVTVAYKKSSFKFGTNPLYIYAYGAYGDSSDPEFTVPVLSLLDRGFIYAIAHVRGGMEMGRDWYDQGRLFHKKNSFLDFISTTEYLLESGYGLKEHVYIEGRSAGGLLVGSVLNMRPDLYHGAHAGVPFVDAVTTMLDESIPLTTGEYAQWGNPKYKKDYEYIKSYSPYDNVKSQSYPHILISSGFNDSQVPYYEPLKWAAKLRQFNKSSHPIVLKLEMESGHSGLTGRYDKIKEAANEISYFIHLEESIK